jgi:hypothetical protein
MLPILEIILSQSVWGNSTLTQSFINTPYQRRSLNSTPSTSGFHLALHLPTQKKLKSPLSQAGENTCDVYHCPKTFIVKVSTSSALSGKHIRFCVLFGNYIKRKSCFLRLFLACLYIYRHVHRGKSSQVFRHFTVLLNLV